MAINRWTGDAPTVAKQLVFRAPEVDATRANVVVTIGGNSLTFGGWEPQLIVDRLSESGFPELIGLTLNAQGEDGQDLAVTGLQNEDFDLSVSIEPTVEVEINQGQTQVTQYSLLSFQGATSGTFTLTCNGETTSAISLIDTGTLNASGVLTAINALSSFAAGDVIATVRSTEIRLEWAGNYAGEPVVVSIDGDGLDNGGRIVIDEVQPARPATNDVWFMGSDADFEFDLSDGTTAVTLKTNDSDAEIAAALTSAWGGRVDVYSELIESSQSVKDRFFILDMKGFAGVTTDLSISNTLPSLGTPGMNIEKIVDRTDTTPSEFWIADLRGGEVSITINGETVEFVDTGSGLRSQLNATDQFQEWWTYNTLSANYGPNMSQPGLNETMFSQKLYLLEWRSDSSRKANNYLTATPATDGGEAFDHATMTINRSGGGNLIPIQQGGPTNVADPAIHSVYLEANDAARQNAMTGTFRLLFPEGETADIAVGADATTLDGLVQTATGKTVATTGSGTPDDPYLIDYTSDPEYRELPVVSSKSILGDGSAVASTSRPARPARSATSVVRVSTDANGGTYRLRSGNEGPVEFTFGDDAAAFKANLELFESLSTTGDTAVSYSPSLGAYLILYQSGLADQSVPVLRVQDSALTSANSLNTTKEITVDPGGPSDFADPKNWSLKSVPDSGDTIVIDRGDEPIIYGVRQFGEVSIDAATNTLTAVGGTDLQNDQKVKCLFGSVAPSGLSETADYFVVNADPVDGTYQLANTISGAAVDITTAGTGPHFCGLIAEDVKIPAAFSSGIGLPFRNDDGYEEYRTRFLQIGIEAAGQIELGRGDGTGSGRLHIDIQGSRGQVTVYDSGSTQTIGQPPIVLDAMTDSGTLLMYGGDVGIATYETDTAKIGSFNVIGGTLVIGSVTVAGNAIWASGSVESNRMSVAGLVHVR